MGTDRVAELLGAALCGDVARLRALLPEAGDLAAIEAPSGVTPLMAAAAAGRADAVELLLQRGSNPARRDAEGRSAAAYARASGHSDLAARLDRVVDQERTMR